MWDFSLKNVMFDDKCVCCSLHSCELQHLSFYMQGGHILELAGKYSSWVRVKLLNSSLHKEYWYVYDDHLTIQIQRSQIIIIMQIME